ncbi:HD domain-containing protein [Umezawaea sp.]|uniref:HD domain-containing protein n=1 Tax=Umezawaea sp. TaxID=1955258 RepID=UPI002ED5F3F7
MTFTLPDAVNLARRAHEGQVDKSGNPYIDHPLRVMTHVDGVAEQMAAVLHDVVEDTTVTLDELVELECPSIVVRAVEALTHFPDEPQSAYLARVAADPIALAVKRADISDNLSPDRTALLEPAERERLREKYETALRLLDYYENG